MSLKEMLPPAKKVGGIPIYGISIKGIAAISERFPWWLQLFGLKVEGGFETQKQMLLASPPLIAAIIAAGTGFPGDEDSEEVASNLALEKQLDFVEAILKETIPSGAAPFAARLSSFVTVAKGQPNESSSRNSQKPATSSSAPTTKRNSSGNSRHDNYMHTPTLPADA